ncbi:MAG TPA: hypothetical protein VKS01_00925 [Bryobacteraceae bacterium]|nr:hypothetical protein [Bryobacteraceae bacterium]
MKTSRFALLLALVSMVAFAQRGGGHGGGGGGGHIGGGGGMSGHASMGSAGGFHGSMGSAGGFRGGSPGVSANGFRGGGVNGFRGGTFNNGFRGGFNNGFRGNRFFNNRPFFGFGFGFGFPYYGYGYPYAYGYYPGYYYDGYSPYDYGYGYGSGYDPNANYYGGSYDPSAYGGGYYGDSSGYGSGYAQPPVVINQNLGQPQPPSPNSSTESFYRKPDYYLIAFSDHTIQAALTYRVEGGDIYWTTRQNEDRHAPLSSVDRAFTQQINRDRHVQMVLP